MDGPSLPASYLAQVYRQHVPAHASARDLQWLWNFAPLDVDCVHRREKKAADLCATHAQLLLSNSSTTAIVSASPNMGLLRLEKYGFSWPPCTSAGKVRSQPSLFLANEWVEVIRIDAAAYIRSGEFYRGAGSRSNWTALGREGGRNGCWFMTQRGSGIFLHVGRALHVANRSELLVRLQYEKLRSIDGQYMVSDRKGHHHRLGSTYVLHFEDHVPICPYVRAHGYDTVVFGTIAGRTGYGAHELVSCRDECTARHLDGACVPGLRTGWSASLPCSCNASMPILNCALTGTDEVGQWPHSSYHFVQRIAFGKYGQNGGLKIPRTPKMTRRWRQLCQPPALPLKKRLGGRLAKQVYTGLS